MADTTKEMLSDYTMRDARIISLQGRLLDYTGHVRRGLSRDDLRGLVQEINALRERNGWAQLDMTGRFKPRGKPAS